MDHLYYKPLKQEGYPSFKYYNEHKRPCKILWAETYSGFSALKGYRKYILWEVFWPAELSKDRLGRMLDWRSGAAPRMLGLCVMATVPTLKVMCTYFWVVCLFMGLLHSSGRSAQCCFLQGGDASLCQLKIRVSASLCMHRHHWFFFAIFFFSLEFYFCQRQYKQVECSYCGEKSVLHIEKYLAVLASRIQWPGHLWQTG